MNRRPVRPQPPEVLSEIHAKKVDLYLHQQGLDTTTPAGKAMFQMMGVFAKFERAMIQERVKSGLARAPPARSSAADDRSQEGARDPRGYRPGRLE
jgi:DNA invertase Pin-like site-specific DNA recombinase